MDFEFAAEERAFAAEVEKFLDEHATPDVADVAARTWRRSSTRRSVGRS